MFIGLLSAVIAGPAVLGTTEGIRLGQDKNKREEHRGRRCNLLVSCVAQSDHSPDLNGRQIVLQNGKLFVGTKSLNAKGSIHPFEGYYVPYPDTQDEGLVSSIDDRQPPMLNWIYVDVTTYEVKYGVRAQAQANLTVPFDRTNYDRRLTFEAWEGFCAVEEQEGIWGLYFDKDRNGLIHKYRSRKILQVQLTRSERRAGHVQVDEANLARKMLQEKEARRFRYRTGAAIIHNFNEQRSHPAHALKVIPERLQVNFQPPFESTPSVALGLTHIDDDNTKNKRLQLTSEDITASGFSADFVQWFDSTILEIGASWFASVDPDFQMGNFVTSEVRHYTRATQKTQKRINFKQSFISPPKIVCWLNYLDLVAGYRYHVTAHATDIDADSFTINVDGIGNCVVANAGCAWIAFPADKPGVDVGTATSRLTGKKTRAHTHVDFTQGVFSAAPGRVKAALSTIDLDSSSHTALDTEVGAVTASGFEWKMAVSPANDAGAGVTYIALE